jgi:hypothetical protein
MKLGLKTNQQKRKQSPRGKKIHLHQAAVDRREDNGRVGSAPRRMMTTLKRKLLRRKHPSLQDVGLPNLVGA